MVVRVVASDAVRNRLAAGMIDQHIARR
jgi:hypothetical protein